MEKKMQAEEIKSGALERGFAVTIPAAELATEFAERLNAFRPKVKLKGFRPGHVPEAHIRKQYGRELMEEAAQELLQRQSRELIEQHGLKPVDAPQAVLKTPIEELLAGDKDLNYEIEIALAPEIKLAEFAEIKLERPVAPLEEQHVGEALDAMAKAQKLFTGAEEGAVLASGDMAVIDLLVQSEGRVAPGGRAPGFRLILGEGRLPHELESALTGHKGGEAVKAETAFPETYPDQSLAGKKAVFAAKIRAVHKKRPAPSYAELAQAGGCKDVAELKTRIRARMEASDKQMQRLHLHARLCEALARLHRFDLPPPLVRRMAEGFERQGVEKSAAQTRAETRVRLQFIFGEIAGKHGLKMEAAELRNAIAMALQRYQNPEERKQWLDYYQTRAGQEALGQKLLEEKILDFVGEKASATLKKVSREELYAPPAR